MFPPSLPSFFPLSRLFFSSLIPPRLSAGRSGECVAFLPPPLFPPHTHWRSTSTPHLEPKQHTLYRRKAAAERESVQGAPSPLSSCVQFGLTELFVHRRQAHSSLSLSSFLFLPPALCVRSSFFLFPPSLPYSSQGQKAGRKE